MLTVTAFAFYSAAMRAISRIDHSDRGIFFVEHEFRVHDKWPKMAGGNKLKRKGCCQLSVIREKEENANSIRGGM